MTNEQKNEVRQYLFTKKLPIDLLMEVEDHFLSQINDKEAGGKMSFEEAFNSTIIAWHDDLKLSWDGNWSLEDTSLLIKTTTKKKVWILVKKAALFGFLCHLLTVAAYFMVPFSVFRIVFAIAILLLMVFPIIVYVKEKKIFDLPKKYPTLRFSIYQDLGGVFFFFPISSIWVFRFVLEINDGFLNPENAKGFVVSFLMLFFFCSQMMIMICQQRFLETLKKVIPYLKENFKVSE